MSELGRVHPHPQNFGVFGDVPRNSAVFKRKLISRNDVCFAREEGFFEQWSFLGLDK